MICKETVRTYCCEDISLIENYEKAINDNTQTWDCHHRLEINNGQIVSGEKLKQLNLYYNRPASELIFLTKFEHISLHSSNLSEETRLKRSIALSGENNPNYGGLSDEHREKLSKAHLGKMPWNYGKKMDSESMQWFNNGIKMIRSNECPEGYIPGRLSNVFDEKSLTKLSLVTKGTKWYNNGIKNVRAKECPEGFVLGRLPLPKEHGLHISETNIGMKFWNNGIKTVRAKECPEGYVPGILKKN